MAETRALESRLRKKLNRFLHRGGPTSFAAETLKRWDLSGWKPILFGGIIRDLVVFGARKYPRDVDVVLQCVNLETIVKDLAPSAYRFNRFGGLHLHLDRWSYDVWPLEKTWAFTVDERFSGRPSELPKTTFLNAEAIAVSIRDGRVMDIYSDGFFECLTSRCIDINYEANPFPALNAVRAVLTAHKLGFDISPRIVNYYLQTVRLEGLESLIEAQDRHYGKVVFDYEALANLEKYFTTILGDLAEQTNVPLPTFMKAVQLELWQKAC